MKTRKSLVEEALTGKEFTFIARHLIGIFFRYSIGQNKFEISE